MKVLTIGSPLLACDETTGDYKIGHVVYLAKTASQAFVVWSHGDITDGNYLSVEPFDRALALSQSARECLLLDASNSELIKLIKKMLEAHRS